MTEAERIDAFEYECSKRLRYPDSLTQALIGYLKGENTLDAVREEWQAFPHNQHPYYAAFLHPSASEQSLDVLDLRVLDLYCVTRMALPFLYTIGKQERVKVVFDYLKSRGEEGLALKWALTIVSFAVGADGQFTPLGRYLLNYLPEQADKLLKALEELEAAHYTRLYASYVKMLLAAQPPFIEMAWDIAQHVQQWAPTLPTYSYSELGSIAGALLKADPARFTDWVRELAGSSSPADSPTRVIALRALLDQNPEQHIELALEAARTPIPTTSKYASAQVQMAGLEGVIKFDPVTYWPLLEEAVLRANYYLSAQAIKLLNAADFDQARPTLQHAVASGSGYAVLRALEILLSKAWNEQEDYALSLLAHRSQQVRARVSKWLVAKGQPVVEGISPYLSHRSADARLAAVQTLGRIGSDPAKTLLADRLAAEKALRVKEAILDVIGAQEALLRMIGIPEASADFQKALAPTPEAISLEAGGTLGFISKPALAWFDVEAAPALRWTTGEPVPLAVLLYLLYRQSRAPRKDALNPQLTQIVALIDHSTSGSLARALYRGWINNGAASKETWLLPLACTLGDDRLARSLRRQIDTWGESGRRTLIMQGVQALALIEGDAALDELNDLAKQFRHGSLNAVIRKAIAVAATR